MTGSVLVFLLCISWLKSGRPVTRTSDGPSQNPCPLCHYLMLPQSGDSTSVVFSSGH